MELQGERLIPAPIDRTWAALNDPEVLKACIAGCESLERNGDDAYVAHFSVRVGPVSARFKGQLRLADVNPPTSYTIHFDGQGGAAGFGKGSADVTLTAQDAATRLVYVARAQVGGKMAQIGSRLVDAASKKLADEFFTKFNAELKRRNPSAEVPAEAAAAHADHGHAGQPAGSSEGMGAGGVMMYLAVLLAAVAGVTMFLAKG
jgi:uncharacterized protein